VLRYIQHSPVLWTPCCLSLVNPSPHCLRHALVGIVLWPICGKIWIGELLMCGYGLQVGMRIWVVGGYAGVGCRKVWVEELELAVARPARSSSMIYGLSLYVQIYSTLASSFYYVGSEYWVSMWTLQMNSNSIITSIITGTVTFVVIYFEGYSTIMIGL